MTISIKSLYRMASYDVHKQVEPCRETSRFDPFRETSRFDSFRETSQSEPPSKNPSLYGIGRVMVEIGDRDVPWNVCTK